MHTVIFTSQHQRNLAKRAIDAAPDGSRHTIEPPKRTVSQNAKMWALLTEISVRKPNDLRYTAEQWKCLFMHALKYEVLYMEGLNGEPFPAGFKTSKLNKAQMSELLEFIHKWCAENGVEIYR